MKLRKSIAISIIALMSITTIAQAKTSIKNEVEKVESNVKKEVKKKRKTVNKLKVYKKGETITINDKNIKIEKIDNLGNGKYELFTSEQLVGTTISLANSKGKKLPSVDTWGEGISTIVETSGSNEKYIQIKDNNKKTILIKLK